VRVLRRAGSNVARAEGNSTAMNSAAMQTRNSNDADAVTEAWSMGRESYMYAHTYTYTYIYTYVYAYA